MPFSPASPASPLDEPYLKNEDLSCASSCQQQQCLTRISATSIYPHRQSSHNPSSEVQTSQPASWSPTRTSAVSTSSRPSYSDAASPKGRSSDGWDERDDFVSLSTAASSPTIAPSSPASWIQMSRCIRLLEPPPSPAESEHQLL